MRNKKLASAILSSLIVTSLAGTPVLAADSTSGTSKNSVKLSFPDVKSDYWGIRHISKLALEGIIEGYEDGAYRAENSVSQQDVLIMAVRMMGLQDEVNNMTSTTVFPDFMLVDSYARNYVAVALQKGLITNEEEKERSSSDKSKENWGQRKATREWVAEIVIRAIGKGAFAQSLSETQTTFNDNSSISTTSLGYVNAAVALKVVDGFEDGTFQPKGAVTRAQMAAFLSRSQKELTSLPAHAKKGYLTTLTSGTIGLMDKEGNTSTYKISPNTVFYGNKNDTAIDPKELQETYEVSIVEVNGVAYYVEIIKDELQMDIKEGKLLKLNMSTMKATLDDFESYDLASDVAVTDTEGRGLSLGDIVTGSTIQLRKSKIVNTDKYTSIIVKQVPVNKTANGAIQNLNKDAAQITLLDTESGQPESYSFSSALIITSTDNSLADLNSLHIGDVVEYTIKNSEVVKISVKKQADVGVSIEGTFKEFSEDKSTLLINKTTGKPVDAYELSENVKVVINGLTNASIYDLAAGDQLKLEVLNNKVTLITVANRSIENLYFAKIVGYDQNLKLLSVIDNKGEPHAYILTDSVSISYAGTKLPLSNFSGTFTVGKYVDLLVAQKKVTQVQMSTQLNGQITQLNLQTNDITLKTDSGQSLSFKLQYAPVVELANKPNSTLSDLKVGDTISLQISFDQSIVTKITTSKTAMYKTVITNVNSKQITVTDESNTQYVISLDGVPIVKPDQTAGSINDFVVDDYVKLSFNGATVVRAEIATPVIGKVTAVNAASSSLTVQDFTGKSQVINAGTNFGVKLNGGSDYNFASIKVGDRVQVMKDASDKLIIQVAATAKREVDNYSSVVNQMYLKSTTAGDKTSYSLYPRAYYHKGTDIVGPSSFVSGDIITIYVLDNKIVEIEK
ncbi:S-layer homology domain-containing protein [Paenibacillus sp. CGMCC 1.16610]|uniref:S-layer homology domain-containing protein n=1 Tax=Paenibacillus anseongense TaxID=2682845 RepID=A0ABW9UFF5_9BACL|nr:MULTISPECIES: S-layer homology domain-containing protein [Paenibacillus]MBA2939929.1 S-layer homology domain-containing protein [Paenibacillus sp. CGMCC 1.16610]MVQ38884.1 S-layer homology domain-containing protein [Paenibacillus anseongense]